MSDLELVDPALRQLISVTQGDQDQSVLADTDKVRQQRLIDREKHHHKQLWTKDPHGGQYRKVAPARKTEVILQTIEPGYEKPKSGPTTNFVGNHMTQGAIDLVQAELSPPADHSLLLLKDAPYQQRKLIAIESHGPIAPEHKTISNYTWWDNGDFICVLVPTKALLSGSASHQVQCYIKEMQIQCSVEVAFAGAQLIHHRLGIPYLHAAVQPEQSSCFLNGNSLQASTVNTAQASTMLYCHTDSSTLKDGHRPNKPRSPDLPSPSHQPCSSTSTYIQASQHAAQLNQQSLQAGTPAAESSGSIASAHQSKPPCLLLKLRKAEPNKTWCTLAGQAPVKQSVKQMPPSPESMAALRRALIQRRQQKQAKGMSACSASAATSWPARPSGQVCMHLLEDAQAASCPSGSSALSQSESVQATPVSADGMLRGHGDEAAQHHTSTFEDLKSEAEAQARRGAYQDAIVPYTTMLQRPGTVSNAEKAHIRCCLAGCLMQTGQLKLRQFLTQAVEECNGAVACAQGLADVSMLVSALRQRAMVYEQLEAYHLSLQDFCCILQMQPGNIAAQQARCRLKTLVKLQF